MNPVWDRVKLDRYPYTYEFEFQGPLTKCVITDTLNGLKGVGYSKLHETDEYSMDVGQKIAASRALRRYEAKAERFYIRHFVRPKNEAV